MNIPTVCGAFILGGLAAMIAPTTVSLAQSNDKGVSVPKEHRRICAQQWAAQHQHEPDQASPLASSRRCTSTLWQPPRSHLGPGRGADHFSPFELADR